MTGTSVSFNTVQDFEVMGVGARRRHELLNSPLPLKLVRHPWAFLPGLEEATLAWLRPQRIVHEEMPSVGALLTRKFREIFPQGLLALGDLKDKILADYLREMPWREGLLDDHFRYFALFLKRRFPEERIWSEIFQREWVRWSRLYEDQDWPRKAEADAYEISPSFQVYSLGEDAARVLKVPSGLYACVYDERTRELQELCLDPVEARFLDWVEGEAAFSKNKLHRMLEEEGFPFEQIRQAGEKLVAAAMVR